MFTTVFPLLYLYLKVSLSRYKILGSHFLLLSNIDTSLNCLLVKSSVEKCEIIVFFPLYKWLGLFALPFLFKVPNSFTRQSFDVDCMIWFFFPPKYTKCPLNMKSQVFFYFRKVSLNYRLFGHSHCMYDETSLLIYYIYCFSQIFTIFFFFSVSLKFFSSY